MATRSHLSAALYELLEDDPEWTRYAANLSPGTPLCKAVEDYRRFLRERVSLTQEEIALANEVLEMMAQRGYRTPDTMAQAIENGDVSLGDLIAHIGDGQLSASEPSG